MEETGLKSEIEMQVTERHDNLIKGTSLLKIEGTDEGITYKLTISMAIQDKPKIEENIGISDFENDCLMVLKKQRTQKRIDDFKKEE